MGRKRNLIVVAMLAVLMTAPPPAGAAAFPTRIPLPEGVFPEGIAVGRGPTAYVGSLADGTIVEQDLVAGSSQEFAPSPGEGLIAVGLDVDRRARLWVAGGGPALDAGVTPSIRAYDTRTGDLVYARQVDAGFVNDVIVTRDAAWFTDSFAAQLIRVPLGSQGAMGEPEYVPIGGDFLLADGFNANGIAATPDGRTLILAQSTNPTGEGGALYTLPADADAASLEAQRILLDGVLAPPDGLVLVGRTLYAVSGSTQAVSVIRLSGDLERGAIVAEIDVPGAITPTTAARFGSRLYVVDAKFDIGGGPQLSYETIAIRR